MNQPSGGLISQVLPDTLAQEIGAEPGDRLLEINDIPLTDLIDYDYLCADDFLTLSLLKQDGEIQDWELEKEPEEDLGFAFAANVFDGVRPCHNRCLFCFIDQLPPAVRPSLRLKDDDYRMSFLSGNYITCTNLRDEDFRRIGQLHISPLYVSVHSVDPLLRQTLLGREEPAEILLTLQRLIGLGCQIHGQIVLCPGYNDGPELSRTLAALFALSPWARGGDEYQPGVCSVAVVPVGLTRYQRHKELRLHTPAEAREAIGQVERQQQACLAAGAPPFVFAADELYLKAGLPFPPAEIYGEFPQLEDGVGMAALFIRQWEEARPQLPDTAPPGPTAIVAGKSGGAVLAPLLAPLCQRWPQLELLSLSNSFFGDSVTVSGLLTGSCLAAGIEAGRYKRVLIPDSMLRFGERVFLDDMTVDQAEQALGCPVIPVGPSARQLVEAIWREE